MEIRLRLTLQFTIVVAFLLATVLGLNYLLAKKFAEDSFIDRLNERALIMASIQLDEDQRHQNQFNAINKKYHQLLPGECIYIYDSAHKIRYSERSDSFEITKEILKVLAEKPSEKIYIGDRVVLGLSYQDGKNDYFIVASAIDIVGRSKLNNTLQTMLLSFVVFLVFIVLAGQFLARKALEPIQNVVRQVHAISADNLHERVSHPNETDEIAQLALTFNKMLKRLEDAFKSQLSFVSNASHELRNPLAVMIGQTEVTLLKPRDEKYYEEVINIIYDEAQRLKHIVNSLLQLSQATPETVQSKLNLFRIDELCLDVTEQLIKSKNYQQIFVQIPGNEEEEYYFEGNRNLMEVAISNLLDNACKYSDGKRVECRFLKLGNIIQLTIIDLGIGMNEEDLKFFMEPFYRSPNVRDREGYGIGMAIAYRILNLHGIKIDVTSELGMGTTINLILVGSESATANA